MTIRLVTARSRVATRYGMVSALALIAAVAGMAVPEAAQAAKQAKHRVVEAMAPRVAGEPIMAIVSLKSQQVTFYDADGWISRAPVSSGTTGRETPAGVFAVIERNKEHHSNMYDDASMPNMQRITWNGIALHGGPLPGYAASHGCVRMPFGFADKMFDKTWIGMRVIVSPIDAEPVAISDPKLLQPKPDAIAAVPARAEAATREATDAAAVAADAKKASLAAARELKPLPAALRKLQLLKKRTDAALASADKALAAATTDEAKARSADVQQKAAAKAAEVTAQVEAADTDLATKRDAATAAKEASKAADAKKTATATAALDAKLALEPVSIYISRATQKLYVRRNTHKPAPDGGGEVFDASIEVPVTIRDADRPIGTHIFTAMAREGDSLRWSAVTIDGSEDAKTALDRITIPQEVLDRVGPTALPRSSIVISDEPLSAETNYRTEFVTVLNDHPQGGFITRKPTAPANVDENVDMANGDNGDGFMSFQNGWDPQPRTRRRRGPEESFIPVQRGWW